MENQFSKKIRSAFRVNYMPYIERRENTSEIIKISIFYREYFGICMLLTRAPIVLVIICTKQDSFKYLTLVKGNYNIHNELQVCLHHGFQWLYHFN